MKSKSFKNKRGIARVFEAALAIVIISFSLIFYLNFNPFTVSSETSSKSASLIESLDTEDVMIQILSDENSDWESEIQQFLTASIPPGTYYIINIYKIVGDDIDRLNSEPIGNIDEESMAQLPETSTIRHVLSPSVARSMGSTVKHSLDIILAIDTSGSMGAEDKITYAKEAAIDFVESIENATHGQNQTANIGVVTYSRTAALKHGLSTDYNSIKQEINNIGSPSGYTNIDEALMDSHQELINSPRRSEGVKSIIVFLTDGCATAYTSSSGSTYAYSGNCNAESFNPRNEAIESADNAKGDRVEIFTLGLGLEFDPYLLKDISSTPDNTHFYHSPSPQELSGIYKAIASSIISGSTSIQGTIVVELTIGSGA